jgi:pyrrolidone-carboxylate peptidase
VHVPYSPEQVAEREGVPSMPITAIADALELVVSTSVRNTHDLAVSAGTLH